MIGIRGLLASYTKRLVWNFNVCTLVARIGDVSIRVPNRKRLLVTMSINGMKVASEESFMYNHEVQSHHWAVDVKMDGIRLYVDRSGRVMGKTLRITFEDRLNSHEIIGEIALDMRTLANAVGGIAGEFRLERCLDPCGSAILKIGVLRKSVQNISPYSALCGQLSGYSMHVTPAGSSIANNSYEQQLALKDSDLRKATLRADKAERKAEVLLQELNSCKEHIEHIESQKNAHKDVTESESELIKAKTMIAELLTERDHLTRKTWAGSSSRQYTRFMI